MKQYNYILIVFLSVIFQFLSCDSDLLDIDKHVDLEIKNIEFSTFPILTDTDFSITITILNKSNFEIFEKAIDSIVIYQSKDTLFDIDDKLIFILKDTVINFDTLFPIQETQINLFVKHYCYNDSINSLKNYLTCGHSFLIINLYYFNKTTKKTIPVEIQSSLGDGIGKIKVYTTKASHGRILDMFIDNNFIKRFDYYITKVCNCEDESLDRYGVEVTDSAKIYDYFLYNHWTCDTVYKGQFEIIEGYCVPFDIAF